MGEKCGAHSHREDATNATLPEVWSDGRRYWRSLDELSDSQEFQDRLHREFPRSASEWPDEPSRRNFLKLMGASVALAGSAGCFKKPEQQVAPYVQQPPMLTPGVPLHFATALPVFGQARGVVVRSDEGRPTKIEGNPLHPASLGATDAQTQAMLLELYDPDRSKTVVRDGQISSWGSFVSESSDGAGSKLKTLAAAEGRGLVIMTEPIFSPTLGAILTRIFKAIPQARWFRHEPVGRAGVRTGRHMAFGKDRGNVQPVYRFDQADVVLSLDGNFLADEPGSLAYARQFTDARRVREDRRAMNRLYVIESTYTITGAMADHRLAIKPSGTEAIARAIAASILPSLTSSKEATLQALAAGESAFVTAVAAELTRNAGRCVVLAGTHQLPVVHALAYAINDHLGNVGKAVDYIDGVEILPTQPWESLSELAEAMNGGEVEALVICDTNPVYTKPAEVDFGASLRAFSLAEGQDGRPRNLSVRHGLYEDETSLLCQWHLPAAHPLESWGDLRAHDGTAAFCQPLINPLYEGRSTLEFFQLIASSLIGADPYLTSHALVRDHWRDTEPWQTLTGESDFEIFWETCLHDGVVPKTAFTPLGRLPIVADMATLSAGEASAVAGEMELVFRPDPNIHDGRFCNSGWLQELPKPLSKICWDNAVLLSVATAKRLGLNNNDRVALSVGDRHLDDARMAVWVLPGHADDCATVYLGYGRTRAGRVGNGTGFNAYLLRPERSPDFVGGLTIAKRDGSYLVVTTQGSQSMEGRDLLRVGTVDAAYRAAEEKEKADTAEFAAEAAIEGTHPLEEQSVGKVRHPLPVISSYPDTPDHADGRAIDPSWQAWGMVIDNNTCIGCNACITACQAENNIAVVGKDQVSRGRELHWLRIDTYFTGPLSADGQPVESPDDDPAHASTNRGVAVGGAGSRPPDSAAGIAPDDVHAYFEPVPCMQCEKAPCELVCPVGATVHDVEGINEMVYNRCVGTRYCSNNCPYKVRRFNFFQYADTTTQSLALGRNPDVTVRSRGVMEKCTYCIQRISVGRIAAKMANRFNEGGKPIIDDGSIVTACQQVCPTRAITFGDIGDPQSQVRKLKEEPLNYVLLEELQTRPRTSYLWRLMNPNPALKG